MPAVFAVIVEKAPDDHGFALPLPVEDPPFDPADIPDDVLARAEVVPVAIAGLVATQPACDPAKLDALARRDSTVDPSAGPAEDGWRADAPTVVVYGGVQYIVDGHHRIAVALMRGDTTIPVAYVHWPDSQQPVAKYSPDQPRDEHGRFDGAVDMAALLGRSGDERIDPSDYAPSDVARTERETLPLADLHPTQSIVIDRDVEAKAKTTEHAPIDVVNYKGKFYIVDGHTRVAAALRRGDTSIRARVDYLKNDVDKVAKFSEDQERDERGRWVSGGDVDPLTPQGGFFFPKITVKDMVLFHGTASAALESIKTDGLVPAKGSGADDWAAKTGLSTITEYRVGDRAASVYMAYDSKTSQQYAKYAVAMNPGSRAVLLAIRVPSEEKSRVVSDEHESQGVRFKGDIPPAWIRVVEPDGSLSVLKDGGVTLYAVFLVYPAATLPAGGKFAKAAELVAHDAEQALPTERPLERMPAADIPDTAYVGLNAEWWTDGDPPVRTGGLQPRNKGAQAAQSHEHCVYLARTPEQAAKYARVYARPLVLQVDCTKLDAATFRLDPVDSVPPGAPLEQFAYAGRIPATALTVMPASTWLEADPMQKYSDEEPRDEQGGSGVTKYSPDQERDDKGRFEGEGGGEAAVSDLPRSSSPETEALDSQPAYASFQRYAERWTSGVDAEARDTAFELAQTAHPELGAALRQTYFGVPDRDLPAKVSVYRVGPTQSGVASYFPRQAQAEAYQRRMGVERIERLTFNPRNLVPSGAGSGEVWGQVEHATARERITKYSPDQERDERGRFEGLGAEPSQFEHDVILGGGDHGERRLDLPVAAGIRGDNRPGFGNCTDNALAEHAKTGADVYVGIAVRADRMADAQRAYDRDGTWLGTEAIPHAWNVADGRIVDTTLGSKDAATHVYFGNKVPDAELATIKSGSELASWHVTQVTKYSPDQERDDHGRFAGDGGAYFHGTTPEAAAQIIAGAFKVTHGGMYGSGVYCTPDPAMAATYDRGAMVQISLDPSVKVKAFTEREYDDFTIGNPEISAIQDELHLASRGDAETAILERQGYGAHTIQRQSTVYVVIHKPEYVVGKQVVQKGAGRTFYLVEAPTRSAIKKADDEELPWDDWGDEMDDLLGEYYAELAALAGEAVNPSYTMSKDAQKLSAAYIKARAAQLMDDLEDDVRALGQATAEAGLSVSQIRSLLLTEFNDLSGHRANRVSRTESTRATNTGRLDAMGQQGIEKFEIVDGGTPSSCDECNTRNGMVVSAGKAQELSDTCHPHCTIVLVPAAPEDDIEDDDVPNEEGF